MKTVDNLIENLNRIIDKRIKLLENEILDLKNRQRDDMSYYGVGGCYRRKENAMDKRKNEIIELTEFKKQIITPVVSEEITYSVLYCNHCHSESYTIQCFLDFYLF